jgi:hypothetical protein
MYIIDRSDKYVKKRMVFLMCDYVKVPKDEYDKILKLINELKKIGLQLENNRDTKEE